MANLTIQSANKVGNTVQASGTAQNNVKCKLKITSGSTIIWVPGPTENDWQNATKNGNNWNITLTLPSNAPSSASYHIYARSQDSKDADVPVSDEEGGEEDG